MTNTSGDPVDLAPKKRPRQKRAIATWERLLDVAAEILETQGVERISTNLIAEKAGITPPTLYRYFPNKYAVLWALGDRLMQQQNVVFEQSIEQSGDDASFQLERSEHLLRDTLDVTERHPGALAIMRAMRAVPVLQEVRLASHHQVADAWTDQLVKLLPGLTREEIWAKARLSVETGYAAIEMAMEETRLDRETVIRDASLFQTAYWLSILNQKASDS
ncbi:MAG: TetR/AcrR family transcriptional regulator [Parvibaculum sp.]